MPGTFSPPPLVSDPDTHHGTCVTHVAWCMPGSLSTGFLWSGWRGKRSRHSWRMRNPQLCVYSKRPMQHDAEKYTICQYWLLIGVFFYIRRRFVINQQTAQTDNTRLTYITGDQCLIIHGPLTTCSQMLKTESTISAVWRAWEQGQNHFWSKPGKHTGIIWILTTLHVYLFIHAKSPFPLSYNYTIFV